MEIQQHPQFEVPNDNKSIWRYMDFSKFVHLLNTNKLYFNRVDNFKDNYEGLQASFNDKERYNVYKDFFKNEPNDVFEQITSSTSQIFANLRKQTFINCWYVNDYESAAMWDLYVKHGEGIAIKTSFQKLKKSFNGDIVPNIVGLIKYIDYNTEWMPEGNIYYPIFHKRKSFAHEQELRLIYHDGIKYPYNGASIEAPEKGIEIGVNLNILIEEVYISPDSPKWIVNLIGEISKKYSITAEVKQSRLYEIC